ncbi:hypothetical protein [Shewanella algae]|jgi:hypothetical protein|uniref:hypothetical protein n=1 Tax=Shewanella algae TaxID=38313 RepID=UPI0031F5ABD9
MEYIALVFACLALGIAVLGSLYLEHEKSKAFKRVSPPVQAIHGKGCGIVRPCKHIPGPTGL